MKEIGKRGRNKQMTNKNKNKEKLFDGREFSEVPEQPDKQTQFLFCFEQIINLNLKNSF